MWRWFQFCKASRDYSLCWVARFSTWLYFPLYKIKVWCVYTMSGCVEPTQLFCPLSITSTLGWSVARHNLSLPVIKMKKPPQACEKWYSVSTPSSQQSVHCHIQGSHPYQSLSYTSGDTAADSPAHVSRAGLLAKDSPRKESLLSNLTGSFRSLHNLLEGTPQRNEPSAAAAAAAKSSSLTRTGTHTRPVVLTKVCEARFW